MTKKEIDPKEQLEQAVNRIGKGYGELLRVFERHGDALGEENFTKAFAFLAHSLEGVREKAEIARRVAQATNGSFSLESYELPAEPVKPARSRPAASTEPAGKNGRVNAFGGRLTKSAREQLEAEGYEPPVAQSVNSDSSEALDEDGLPVERHDTPEIDGVKFIAD